MISRRVSRTLVVVLICIVLLSVTWVLVRKESPRSDLEGVWEGEAIGYSATERYFARFEWIGPDVVVMRMAILASNQPIPPFLERQGAVRGLWTDPWSGAPVNTYTCQRIGPNELSARLQARYVLQRRGYFHEKQDLMKKGMDVPKTWTFHLDEQKQKLKLDWKFLSAPRTVTFQLERVPSR